MFVRQNYRPPTKPYVPPPRSDFVSSGDEVKCGRGLESAGSGVNLVLTVFPSANFPRNDPTIPSSALRILSPRLWLCCRPKYSHSHSSALARGPFFWAIFSNLNYSKNKSLPFSLPFLNHSHRLTLLFSYATNLASLRGHWGWHVTPPI